MSERTQGSSIRALILSLQDQNLAMFRPKYHSSTLPTELESIIWIQNNGCFWESLTLKFEIFIFELVGRK